MRQILFYQWFFPHGKELKFRKLRWIIMIIIQEVMMKKWKAIFKFFINRKYNRDIMVLCDILSKAPLTSNLHRLPLRDINMSHEVNYPEWVTELENRILDGKLNEIVPLKVFRHKGQWLVIDGNHRLQAMKNTLHEGVDIPVRVLHYKLKES